MKNLFDEIPQICSKEICLKEIREEDADAVREMTENDNVYRYLPTFLFERQYSDTKEMIRALYAEHFRAKDTLILGIYLREEDCFCGIAEVYGYKPERRKACIGYRLSERYWGKGIATKTARLLTRYLLEETDITEIEASVMMGNPASERVLEKAGFRRTAVNVEEDWGFGSLTLANNWELDLVQTAKTEGFSMDYFRFGSGEKTMVILPGLSVQPVMGSAKDIIEAYRLFTKEYTVYVFDRRNELPDPYTMNEMAEDTAAVMKNLGLKDVYLFGASQGGMMSLLIAADHPDLVRKAVIGSAAAYVSDAMKETMKSWRELALQKDPEGLYLGFAEKLYPSSLYEAWKDFFREASKTVTEDELKRFIRLADTMDSYDARGVLSKIGCPVLVIGAADDNVVGPEAAKELCERLPDAELYIYEEGYGHAAFDTAPDYKERLYRFFGDEKS
ncbi:MAG: GNAT family N-acetyltransferase [Erysipelotrichales bacterium]|nr:GNAT family N-acetyltransferase [Erysipelotrichales bacterium]